MTEGFIDSFVKEALVGEDIILPFKTNSPHKQNGYKLNVIYLVEGATPDDTYKPNNK